MLGTNKYFKYIKIRYLEYYISFDFVLRYVIFRFKNYR